MSGLRIHLSNGTVTDAPSAKADEVDAIGDWFEHARPDEILLLKFADQGKEARIQKRHIVQIESIS